MALLDELNERRQYRMIRRAVASGVLRGLWMFTLSLIAVYLLAALLVQYLPLGIDLLWAFRKA